MIVISYTCALQYQKVYIGRQWLRSESQRQYCSTLLFPRKQIAVRWLNVVKQRAVLYSQIQKTSRLAVFSCKAMLGIISNDF